MYMAVITLLIYILNIYICAAINVVNQTREPRSFMDFLKLAFLPYVLLNLKKIKDES
jgi:hypothetical protein